MTDMISWATDGATVTVPACTIFRFEGANAGQPLATKCQIYVDLAPLCSAHRNAAH